MTSYPRSKGPMHLSLNGWKRRQGKTIEHHEQQDGGGLSAWRRGIQPAAFVPERAWNGAYTESCSDNSSIMRTVEGLLTTAVKRFVGRICDLAETRAPRPVREGNQRLRHSKCLSPSLTEITMAQKKTGVSGNKASRARILSHRRSSRGSFPSSHQTF